MRYASVCSGIEAATVAWEGLGWEPAFFSEIEAFPSAVLKHHWPKVPNMGNMENLLNGNKGKDIDIFVGGTPCQSFSIAGHRRGIDDPRGNLMLTFGAIADAYRPRWIVWENVPGVLSSNGGRDFGSFVGMLAQCGYGFAYRIFDAQYFGVPQRRRRVFLVAHRGDWRRAAAVLFDAKSLQRRSGSGQKKEKDIAKCLMSGTGIRCDWETETFLAFHGRQDPVYLPETSLPLEAKGGQCICFQSRSADGGEPRVHKISPTLRASTGGGNIPQVCLGLQVRKLTPVECERLQGFPDNHTRIPWRGRQAEACPDTPRYRAIGNSMAVPVMRWIGKRIERIDGI